MEKFVLPLSAGVGIVDGDRLCVSVIDESGNKKVGGQKISYNQKFLNNIVFRSFAYFFYCVWFYFKAIFLQEELIVVKKDKSKKEKKTEKILIGSKYILLLAFLLSVFVYAFLVVGVFPSFLFEYIFPFNIDYYFPFPRCLFFYGKGIGCRIQYVSHHRIAAGKHPIVSFRNGKPLRCPF